mgnify:CR=1 FL=1
MRGAQRRAGPSENDVPQDAWKPTAEKADGFGKG